MPFMQVSLDMGWCLVIVHESDNYPVMTADVCFQPGGYEKDLFLYHQNDIVLDENESGYGFVFKGGQSLSDTTGMTYVKWGCEGFIELQLGGAVIFRKIYCLKDSGLTSDDTPINERVKVILLLNTISCTKMLWSQHEWRIFNLKITWRVGALILTPFLLTFQTTRIHLDLKFQRAME